MWRNRTSILFLASLLLWLWAHAAIAAPAASPAARCHALGTDDTLRPIPASLVAKARQLFDLSAMPDAEITRSTYYRCFAHDVLICTSGANLPCGKANRRRTIPGASAWCVDHPDADFIPMVATGHDTIYRWQCRGGKAVIVGTASRLDQRGFIAALWKRA